MKKDFSELLKEKKDFRKNFFKQYKIPKTARAIVVNNLENEKIRKSITEACLSVDIFVIENNSNLDFFGVDAIIADKIDKNFITNISDNLVIPIVLNPKDKIFKEFNPMKFEWNAFLFEKIELFSIFEKISRMLENSLYIGDRRTLLKNIFALNNPIK